MSLVLGQPLSELVGTSRALVLESFPRKSCGIENGFSYRNSSRKKGTCTVHPGGQVRIVADTLPHCVNDFGCYCLRQNLTV